MKGDTLKLIACLQAVGIFISGALLSSNAIAVECGDTIYFSVTMNKNLDCELSQTNPVALTIVGPTGNLDMNGNKITCSTQTPNVTGLTAIVLQGSGGQVRNGILKNCIDGIAAEGQGYHQISNMEVINVIRNGIFLFSDSNTLKNTSVSGAAGSMDADGLEVLGNANTISQCTFLGDGDEGIEIGGQFNTLTYSYVEGFSEDGLELDGSYATISHNTFKNNGETGILINGNFSTIGQNQSTGNGQVGIDISGGSNNTISHNTVTHNGSTASSEFGGIVVTDSDSSGNLILGNIASENLQYDLIDLFDPTCSGTNIWLDNQFGTANPDCLK
ncbi:right-handed parallel beta-helix repeat-containing protein [Microbulbifer epialgicus]|uniref:Right-handed parallel beta-helix repeat-containing protein n=1 Tax=Microbulbifer epialgicus TaxID=393907 RepID=A0ABV4P6A5_9GAMM